MDFYLDHLFDEVDAMIKLDAEQKAAILCNAPFELIIAGAGSGKTTVLTAKVKYLIDCQQVKASQIVMLTFTNEAVAELKNRIQQQFHLSVTICTFHKLALEILKNFQKVEIFTERQSLLKELICQYWITYPSQIPLFFLYFSSLWSTKKKKDKIAIKQALWELLNFRYEKVWENHGSYFFQAHHKVYQLQFLHKKKRGRTYFQKDRIIVYLSQEPEQLLMDFLQELEQRDLSFFEVLNDSTLAEKVSLPFLKLCMDFFRKFENNDFTVEQFAKIENRLHPHDHDLLFFLRIMNYLITQYQHFLTDNNYVDFACMIRLAKERLQQNPLFLLPYKYLIIDEYQDISLDRFAFIREMLQHGSMNLIVVGDDWQSIYAFSGSRIELFHEFTQLYPATKQFTISHTYRNSQELIRIAGNFIQKNPNQIKKQLLSEKHLSKPLEFIFYWFDQRYYQALNRCFAKISKEMEGENKKILLLGRYQHDIQPFLNHHILIKHQNKIVSYCYPTLQLDYLTIHAAKGLGYDYVILLNMKMGEYGFPSEKTDNRFLTSCFSNDLKKQQYEERRLLYVALTRTKNKVYLLVPRFYPSTFYLELKKESIN